MIHTPKQDESQIRLQGNPNDSGFAPDALVDEEGVEYRAMQCAVTLDESTGEQIVMWFHTDTGGTPNLRKKAAKQRRDGIADDVYRAVSDITHMNRVHDEDIQFVMDFTDDYLDRKAAESLKEDDEGAA